MLHFILNQPSQDDNENEERQDKLEIRFEPAGKFYAFFDIDFFQIIVKSPAVFAGAEKGKYKRTDRKNQIADDEIFAVKNASFSYDLHIFPYAETEYAGNASEKDKGQ